MSHSAVDLSTLALPAIEPWPTDPDAIARLCAAVTTLSIDAYGLRELHANRAWNGAPKGLLQRLSHAPASDLLLRPSRAHLLGALVEAVTLGEQLRPAALALVDQRRTLDALRARYPRLVTVRVFSSAATLGEPERERDGELFALVDELAARGVRSDFDE